MNSNGDAPPGTVNHEPTPAVASPPRARKTSITLASSPRTAPATNGTRNPPNDDATNESEAETVVLEGASLEQPSPKAPLAIKREYSDEGIEKVPTQSSKPTNAVDSRKNSQTSGVDDKERAENGAKDGVDQGEKSPVPTSLSGELSPRQTKENSPALSPPLSTTRPRSASTNESRKRKHREESISKPVFEPPRQKAKTEGLRESRTLPTSPATPGLGLGRPHKRSQSIQSVVHSIPGRKRRDVTALHIPTERRDWSESSSERSSSPRPHSAVGMRTKRSSHRSIASPARTMAHKKDKFGATRLARESEKGELDRVKEAYDAAPEDLDEPDYAGITPLQKAALQGHDDIVEFLISKGCRTDCKSQDLDTPLIDAVENSHVAVVRLLLHEGHVNPHHKNNKGQRAIDVVDNSQDEAEEIRKLLKEAMNEHMDDPMDEEDSASAPEPLLTRLRNNEYNTETLIERAGDGDKAAVNELISNGVKANIACGVAASRGGHYDILSVLLATGLKADLDPAKHTDTPLVVAIGKGHLNIVKMLLGLEGFNPTRRNREGKTYYQVSEERKGPHWQEEYHILKEAYNQYQKTHYSPKRSRKDGSKANVPKKRKPSRERSASPPYEPKRANLGKTTGSHPPQKSRRLISGKEVAARRNQRRVSSDESSDDESEDDVRPPGKRRAYSDGEEDGRPARKPKLPRSESHHVSKRPHSDDSEQDDHPKRRPKIRTRVEKTHRSRPTHTPDAESDHESRPPSKIKNRVVSGEKMKKRRPSDISTENKPRTAHTKSSPAPPDKAEQLELARERRQEADKWASEAKRKVADEQEAIRRAADEESSRKKAAAEAEAKRAQEAAEASRREEEEAQAKKRAAEEAEELKRQERLSARRERVSKLPRALRRACELGKSRPVHFSGNDVGISGVFLPLCYVAPQDAQPAIEVSIETPHIPSFQAIGILGLPELDLAHLDPPYSDWPRIPMDRSQRELLLQHYDVTLLAHDPEIPMDGMAGFNVLEHLDRIREAERQFLEMDGLYWIPADRLSEAVEKREDLKALLQGVKDEGRWSRVAFVELPGTNSGMATPMELDTQTCFHDSVLERSKSSGNASDGKGKEKEKVKGEEGEGKENAVESHDTKINGNG